VNAAQSSAFQANAGFTPGELSSLVLGIVFAVLLLWGMWALRTAYTGWTEGHLTQGQFLGVAVRFLALYLTLSFFLLS
jgi:integrating conjugative element protein (TIGR03758 family)